MTVPVLTAAAVVTTAGAELLSRYAVSRLRPVFPWLITQADEQPVIAEDLVRRHAQRSFDPELGWCRQPDEEGVESTDTGTVSYRVDERGARYDPSSASPARPQVACFGDSFTFCRLVNDDETWPHHLSEILRRPVVNYGVGNYGLDQALLRLWRELPGLDADVVIMGVVPETIARVHSYWKHYFEYGNVLAFKPRFTLEHGKLVHHPPAVRTPEDYLSYTERLPAIQALDPFFDAKFRRDQIHGFHLARILRRARRHLPVLGRLLYGLARGDREQAIRSAFRAVLRDNARWTARLYADPSAGELLRRLVMEFAETCRRAGKQPILLIMPQPVDLASRRSAHESFATALRTVLPVVDLTTEFRRHPPHQLYVQGRLGPHASDFGNRLIARQVADAIDGLATATPASIPIEPEHPRETT